MSRRLAIAVFSTSIAIAAISSLAADAAPTSSPTNPAPGVVTSMKIVVAEVSGLVQVRTGEDAPWQAAKVGMELNEGAEFRTGPRSSVTCQIPPDQTLTLDRLGTVKIAEAIKSGNKIKTDMVMKYGRTHYDIEAAGVEHESTIRSPSSTLAVRGTEVSLYDQPPFTPQAESFHGRASFRNAQRELRFGGTSFTQVANDKSSAAATALSKQTVDPKLTKAARSASDNAYITDEASRGAILSFSDRESIPVIRNGPAPLTDAQLKQPGSLPGTLDFVLRWYGNANLNLVVDDAAGMPIPFNPTEFLYPVTGLNTNKSGGTIPYDNRGGPRGGMEFAYWNGTYPHGVYGMSALHISGTAVNFSLNAFVNNQPVQLITSDSQGNLIFDNQVDGTISGQQIVAAIAFIPPLPPPPTDNSAKAAKRTKSAGETPSNATLTKAQTTIPVVSRSASPMPNGGRR